MTKYKDALIQELNAQEPEETFEGEGGETFGLYRVATEDIAGAILCEDSEGGVTGTFYAEEDELNEAWDALSDEDEEDEDPEDSEEDEEDEEEPEDED